MKESQNNSITLSNLFGSQISKEEALLLLQQDSETYQRFLTFPLEEQENVLSFIQGQHGLKITLDTFHQVVQNIDTKLQAWLTFLSSSEPADILKLVTTHPEFKEYYKDIVAFRKKPKELISMYSEALAILDHNTELYMISELQNTVKEKDATIAEKDATIAALQKQIAELSTQIPNSK